MPLALALLAGCHTPPPEVSQDHPEPGRQGEILPGEAVVLPQPYSKGVRVVGHAALGNRDTNVQMWWIDHCAYVASSQPNFLGFGLHADPSTYGTAVIDVSNPSAPQQVGLLRDKGAIYAAETLSVSTGARKVIAAGAYGNGAGAGLHPSDPAWLDIYDASDCAHPRLMSEVSWPENAHTVAVSPNGRRVYGLHIEPFSGRGGIMVMDISDLAHPRYIGKFGATAPDGRTWEFAPHEMSISPDERRFYVGVVGSRGGDLNRDITGPEGYSPARVAPGGGGIYILDSSDFADGKADPKLRLIGTAEHGGWHSVMRANINGVPYVVGGGELTPCPGAYPQIVNIADEHHPFIEGAFRLAMNHEENCPATTGAAAVGGVPSATLHFNDVDSADHTRLGLFNFTYSGLRIADLRDPKNPVEVAYFRPGDFCTGHVRYMPATGQIWSVCNASGFWITQLSPEVRAALRR